jgi:hypothetical protein
VVALAFVFVAGIAAVATDTFGAASLFDRAVAKVDRLLAGPVPDRSAPGTVLVADPSAAATDDEGIDESVESPAPTSTAAPASSTGSVPTPVAVSTATPRPTPARVAVNVDIVSNHKKVFAHEIKDTWCASAGVQMTLAVLGLGDNSNAFQREIQGRVHEWESKADSHNGDWGPSAMALALKAYGAKGYEVRAYQTRQGALRDAAKAIQKTNSPVLLMAWRGAHTWVMTGFRADADPSAFGDAKIQGTYILDPWYPTISSIWGPSDPPGTYQDGAEMVRNYLKWKRPEGLYPTRDGLYLAVVPTVVKPAS